MKSNGRKRLDLKKVTLQRLGEVVGGAPITLTATSGPLCSRQHPCNTYDYSHCVCDLTITASNIICGTR